MITRLTFDQISTAVHDAYEACKDIKARTPTTFPISPT